MNFFKKYELLKMLQDGEVKSFQATERETSRPVMFHMLQDEKSDPAGEPLGVRARRIGSVIEVGEFGGTTFIVTEPIDPFTNLRDWIERQVPAPAIGIAPAPAPALAPLPPTPVAGPGEFTQIFGGGALPAVPKPAASVSRPPAKVSHEAGEFTRFFGAGVNQDPVSAPFEPSLEPETGKRPFEPAGEFTRMFGGTLPPAGQPFVTPPTGAPPSSPFDTRLEFTRSSLPAAPAHSATPAPAMAAEGPSEFTRAITGPAKAEPPVPTAPPAPAAPPAVPITPPSNSRQEILIMIASFVGLLSALALFLYFRRS